MRPLANTPLTELNITFGTRPLAPNLPEATNAHRQQGRMLGMIHRHHLQELSRIARLLDQIETGEAGARDLAKALNEAVLARNMRHFGTLCGRQCKILQMHHDAEEAMMFPPIAAQNQPGLQAVVERLRAEHMVVHELICRLQDAVDDFSTMESPQSFAHARDVFKRLVEVVASHFRYEEDQLAEAIGLYVKAF